MSHLYPAPRTGFGGQRIPEFLENLKVEYDSLVHDANMYKMQRDDYERKLQTQLTELNSIQQTLYDLERNHAKIKQQYEEEIMRLRRQLDIQTGGTVQSNVAVNSSSGGNNPSGLGGRPNITSSNSGMDKGMLLNSINNGPNSSAQNLSSNNFFTGNNSSTLPAPSVGGGNIQASSNPSGLLALSNASSLPRELPRENTPSAPIPSPLTSGNNSVSSNLASIAATISASNSANTGTVNSLISSTKRPVDADFYQAKSGFLPLSPMEKKTHQETPTAPVVSTPSAPSNSATTITANTSTNIIDVDVKQREKKPTHENGNANSNDKTKEEGGVDWIVGYNPGVMTSLNIDMMHNLEHQSVVCCVKFSNDGKYLATGCNRSAQMYDVVTGEKVHIFSDENVKDGDLYIRSVSFSPDGKWLACGAEDKTVKLWDIERKRLHHTFSGHELDIYSLDFSRDGNFIVSGSGDKKAKIWDVEKGECVFTLGNEEVGPKDGVTSVAFSPDGRLVAAGSLDRVVRLWDAQTGYFLERYEGHMDSVYSVAFSPDGKSLASGSLDKTLKLWDLSGSRSRSRCKSTFTGHKDFVLSVAFSPDGNWLISGSKDRSVQFWDPRSAVTHMMLQGHKNSVISVAVSPVGGTFATGSGDFRARIWRYD